MSLPILCGCRTKTPVTNPLYNALVLFEQGALVRSIFQRAGEADFKCCQREIILPFLIPIHDTLCSCLMGTVQ